MQEDQAVIQRWNNAAPFWEKHRETLRQMFVPVTAGLIEDAGIVSGNAVLDIATGAGEPALSLTTVVGPAGKVVGIDPVPGMVATARRAADRAGAANIQFEVAFADGLPFPANTFDAVVSRFGAMFFPSPVDAVREMLRVLKPGRKLALAVWGFEANNPFFSALSSVLNFYVEAPPPDPDALDAFRYATPGKLRNVLAEAGAIAPSERLMPFPIEAQLSVEDYWTMRCETSEKLREKVATLSAEQLVEAKRDALDALRAYCTDGGISFPAQAVIVSGSKS